MGITAFHYPGPRLTSPACSMLSACRYPRSFSRLDPRDLADPGRSLLPAVRCHFHHSLLEEAECVRILVEGAPAEDADLRGRCSWTRTTYFREATPRYEHRTSMTTVEMTDAPTEAVTNSMAESVAVDTGRTDRTWPTTLEKLGRAG